jgi:hypothetical protein
MTNSINVVRSDAVVKSIAAAVKMEGSLINACKNIGKMIAEQLNPMGLPAKDAVAAGMALYKADMTAAVRGYVSSALTLALAAPDTPVSYLFKGEEKHTTAKDAIALPKHEFSAAASALRADTGTGRAAGGGRTPKTPVGPDKKPSAVQTTENNTDLAFAAFIHNLPVYFNDPAKALQITATLKEMGLKLQQIK